MPLTRDFKETIRARVERDPKVPKRASPRRHRSHAGRRCRHGKDHPARLHQRDSGIYGPRRSHAHPF